MSLPATPEPDHSSDATKRKLKLQPEASVALEDVLPEISRHFIMIGFVIYSTPEASDNSKRIEDKRKKKRRRKVRRKELHLCSSLAKKRKAQIGK